MVRQVSSSVQESPNRLGFSWKTATQLEKWTAEEVRAVVRFLWIQNATPVNIHRHVVAVYEANVIPVEQMRKWWRECHGRWQKWPPPSSSSSSSSSNPTHSTTLLAPPRDFKVFGRRKKKNSCQRLLISTRRCRQSQDPEVVSRTSPPTARAFESPVVPCDMCLNRFGDCVEKWTSVQT